jgi:hypothetical protein
MTVTLSMTGEQHRTLLSGLFPGDGRESAALLLCNRRHGTSGDQGLIVRTVHPIPDQGCLERTRTYVAWPTREYLLPLVEEIEREDLGLVCIHSHPTGFAQFSDVDDESDRTLFPSVHGWLDRKSCHGSAVMLPDGKIFGRVVSAEGEFEPMSAVRVADNEIHVWYSASAKQSSPSLEFTERLLQAFGSGTVSALRSMRVGIVGCSGTGSVVFDQLLRCGVGEFVLVDPEVVESVNLNRMVNSQQADADARTPKVLVLEKRAVEIGLGTKVTGITDSVLNTRAAQEIARCDIVFGCVDSAEGRHVLNMLTAAYLIPYFDVGVHIEADGKGGVSHAIAAAHYVLPGESLLSRGVYGSEQLTAEAYRRTDPDFYSRNVSEGYLRGAVDGQAAVISLNTLAATMAVNDLLARLHGFRLDDNAEFAYQAFSLTAGYYAHRRAELHCPVFAQWVGIGDYVLEILRKQVMVASAV